MCDDLGKRIKHARISAGLTQAALAKRIDKGVSTVQKYELGLVEPPLSVIASIADALGVSVAYLEGYESMEVRAIMDAIERKDAREFERLLGLKEGSIKDMDPELKEGESVTYFFARDDYEAVRQTKIVSAFSHLNEKGQQIAVERVEELTKIPDYQRNENPPECAKEDT